jgi:hypothetical protein
VKHWVIVFCILTASCTLHAQDCVTPETEQQNRELREAFRIFKSIAFCAVCWLASQARECLQVVCST